MKTLTAFLVALTALSVQAATLKWDSGGTKVAFGGTTITSNTSVNLVLLGDAGDVSDMYTIDYTAPGSITTPDFVANTTPMTTGRNIGAFTSTYASGSDVVNGKRYGVYITYNDGTDTWYNFATDIYQVSGVTLGNEAITASFAFDFGTQTTITADGQTPSGWTRINIPVTPVPEPATGALALAGIALLFRRRKA